MNPTNEQPPRVRFSPAAPLVEPARPRPPARRGRWGVALGLVALVVVVAGVVASRRGGLFDDEPALRLERITTGGADRLAVLPFVDATGDAANGWVRDGLAAMVSRALAETQGLAVVPYDALVRQIDARGLASAAGARELYDRLAVDLGATLVLDVTVRGTREGFAFELVLRDAAGEESRGELEDPSLMSLAERSSRAVARTLAPDALAVDFSRTFSGDAFLDQLYGMGVAVLDAGDPAAAQAYFEIALSHRPSFLRARAQLARCARQLGDLETSRARQLEVLAQAQGHGDRPMQAESLAALGELAALEGRAGEADELLRQAFDVYAGLEQSAGQSRMLEERARVALGEGQDERAAALLDQLLERQRGLGDRAGEAETSRQLGSLSLRLGELDRAETWLETARKLAREMDDLAAETNALASLGELAHRRGELELAESHWSRALAFYRQRQDRRRTLLIAGKLAELAAAREDWQRAEALYLDVVELAAGLNEPASEARASLELARILLHAGYAYQARPHLDRALALDTYLDDPVAVQRVIARQAYEREDYRLAVESQRAVRALLGDAWSAADAALLRAYERALASGARQPLPL